MKTKRRLSKRVVVTTALTLLVLGSVGASVYAAGSVDTIKKNKLMTETVPAMTAPAPTDQYQGEGGPQADGPITQAQAIETGKRQLLSLFGADVTKGNLTQNVDYLEKERLQGTSYASPVWQVAWITPYTSDGTMNSHLEPKGFESHSITLDAATGNVLNISSEVAGDPNQPLPNIPEENVKSMVRAFIDTHGLAKGTTIAGMELYPIKKGYYVGARLSLANGEKATVMVSMGTGKVIAYEGNVEVSAFPAPSNQAK